MKYPAFVVIYHHKFTRDFMTYYGIFSSNLKIVYLKDDPLFLQDIMGLEIIGFWCGSDVDPEIIEFVGSRIRG